jgi:hypothetical protein
MAATPPPDVEGFLSLLGAEPTLLPAVPDTDRDLAIARRLDEAHACLRCGRQAQEVFIAETKLGPRWLDLCEACGHWLRTAGP